mmetsp:Transcript_2141/g.3721  ORF Transcript_2141/g.3721 Transcript_2141/m.3721 type:complete len:99 (-) Transcript_2141:1355-1651(-)
MLSEMVDFPGREEYAKRGNHLDRVDCTGQAWNQKNTHKNKQRMVDGILIFCLISAIHRHLLEGCHGSCPGSEDATPTGLGTVPSPLEDAIVPRQEFPE